MKFDSAVRTHVGLKRKLNEDSILCRPDIGLWAIADGMGGHDSGEVASAMIVEALAHAPAQRDFQDRVADVALALEAVNDSLIVMGRSLDQQRSMGSTVVALVIGEGRFQCTWVGDSRAYRIRQGRIEQLTVDHSLVQDLVRAGMLDADEAENHPNANVLTRAVGSAPRLQADSTGDALDAGDTFVLASDGLTRLLGSDEIMAEVTSHRVDAAADRLIDAALARGAPDNVSVAVIAVG